MTSTEGTDFGIVAETIVATAVPRWPGASDHAGDLLLSAHLAPRLVAAPGQTLADFAWLSQWPDVRLQFEVLAQGQRIALPATIVDPPAPADVALAWASLVPATTAVRSVDPPSGDQGQRLRAALTFSSPAVLANLQADVGARLFDDAGQLGVHLLPPWWGPDAPAPALPTVVPTGFFDPAPAGLIIRPPDPPDPPDPLNPPGPDLHDRLAYLHDFPFVLRQLGLTVDLRVAGPLPADWPATGPVRLLVTTSMGSGPGSGLRVLAPWSAVASRPAPADGFLAGEDVRLVPIDTVHGAQLLAGGARTAGSVVRATGLSVVDAGSAGVPTRHLTLADRADAQTALLSALDSPADDGDSVSLVADDLLAGYVVDIADLSESTTPTWRSLCARAGELRPVQGGRAIAIPDGDEGFVSETASTRTDGTLRLLDVIARWQGWSAVAARPQAPDVDVPAHSPQDGVAAAAVRPADGSLPRLRYGHAYRGRVRTMNIAGNAPPLDSVPDGVATDAVTFLRTEPVGSPAVALGSTPGLAESARHLVVYSQAESSVREPPSTTTRLLFPPRTTLDVAERHGCLDSATAAPDATLASALQGRADASLWTGSSPLPGAPKSELVSAQLHPPGSPVSYLPDPMSAGVAAAVLASSDAAQLPVGTRASAAFTSDRDDWPAAWQPVVLSVVGVAASAVAALRPTGAGLEVDLPQGHQVTLSIATTPDPARLAAEHAAPAWAAGAVEGARRRFQDAPNDEAVVGAWHALSTAGAVRAVTPAIELTLVHAVQQPLFAPTFLAPPVLSQAAGSTQADVTATVQADPLTTDKVDVYATWDASADTGPGGDNPERAVDTVTAHIGSVPVPAGTAATVDVSVSGVLDLRDTRAYEITFYAVSSTRFKEYFLDPTPGRNRPPVGPLTTVGPSVTVLRPSTARPRPVVVHSVVPTLAWGDAVTSPGRTSRTRLGNGLRIWVERPARSSGMGEQLAVLFAPGASVAALQQSGAHPMPTLWALDPTFGIGGALADTVSAGAFGRSAEVDGLTSAEAVDASTPGSPDPQALAAVPYDLEYDPQRDLWFCDVLLPGLAGSYAPMIDLLVAAYQPNSIADSARLSLSTASGWTTVIPDRIVTFTVSPDDNPLDANEAGQYVLLDVDVQGPTTDREIVTFSLTSDGAPVPLRRIVVTPPPHDSPDHGPVGGTQPGGGSGTVQVFWVTDPRQATSPWTAKLPPDPGLTITLDIVEDEGFPDQWAHSVVVDAQRTHPIYRDTLTVTGVQGLETPGAATPGRDARRPAPAGPPSA